MKKSVTKRGRRAIGVGVGLSLLAFAAPLAGTASATHIGCGTTITASTTLHSDIGPCSGDGIIIGANNITLNLNGHEIFGTPGPGDGNQAGIRLPFRSGVTITSGRGPQPTGAVRDFDAGVFINGGSKNNVGNLIVRDNVGPLTSESLLGDGIILFHSAMNRIINNTVLRNGYFDGIGVLGLGSNDNIIRGNTVEENMGISEEESPELSPDQNVPHYINAPGHGIIVSHFLDQPLFTDEAIYHNHIQNNVVRQNDGSGISTVANLQAAITGNVVEDNAPQYYGNFFRLYDPYPPSSVVGIGVTTGGGLGLQAMPTNVLVKNNVVNRNGLVGIHIHAMGNRIATNQVFDNGAFGINTYSGSNSFLNNRTSGNLFADLIDQNDIDPGGCDNNRWWGNTWGELQPLGAEFGLTTAYYPDCTAAGGSGPNPPAGDAASASIVSAESPALPTALSDQTAPGARGFSG